MSELTLHIDGMHCGACVKRVTQALHGVDGVEVDEVRLGAARLQVPDGVSTETLIAGLANAGFPAREEK
jgi:copper chaperone